MTFGALHRPGDDPTYHDVGVPIASWPLPSTADRPRPRDAPMDGFDFSARFGAFQCFYEGNRSRVSSLRRRRHG
jgi:hypothetical protein